MSGDCLVAWMATALKKKIKIEMHGYVGLAINMTRRTYQRGMKSDFLEHVGDADGLGVDADACLPCFYRMFELRFHFFHCRYCRFVSESALPNVSPRVLNL